MAPRRRHRSARPPSGFPGSAAGADDAGGDLAAVGDEDPADGGDAGHGHHIRKTPKESVPCTGAGVHGRQGDRQHGAGVARVDDAVVPDAARWRRARSTRPRPACSNASRMGANASSSHSCPARLGLLPGDDGEHAGQLLGSHHGDAVVGPAEDEARVVGPAGHAVVAGAVGGAHHERDHRDAAVAHGVDELRTVLDDAALLVAGADHESGDVLQEQDRHVHPVAQLDELGALVGLLAEQDAVVGEDAHGIAVDVPPAGDQRGAVQRLELVELAAVEHAGQDLARLEGDLDVRRGDAEQLLGVVQGRAGGLRRSRAGLAPVQVADDVAADPQRVGLVEREVVGQPGLPRVHLGAAERLVVGVLVDRHLHQRAARRGRPGRTPSAGPRSRSCPARRRRRPWTNRTPA